MVQMTYLQNRNSVTDVENKLVVIWEKGGINCEIGIDIYMLLHIKQITRTCYIAQRALFNTL